MGSILSIFTVKYITAIVIMNILMVILVIMSYKIAGVVRYTVTLAGIAVLINVLMVGGPVLGHFVLSNGLNELENGLNSISTSVS